MSTSNQIFSSRRFCLYLNKYFVQNRTTLLVSVASILLLLPTLVFLMTYLADTYDSPYYLSGVDAFWGKERNIFLFMFVIVMAAAGNEFYSAYNSKGRRIDQLMLPVSNPERFATYFLIYFIGTIVMFVISSIFADWLRYAIWSHYAAPGVYVAMTPAEFVLTGTTGDILSFIQASDAENGPRFVEHAVDLGRFEFSMLISAGLFASSFFALGSIVWQSKAFIKTLFCGFIINAVSGQLMFLGWKAFFNHGATMPRSIFEISMPELNVAVCIASAAFVIFTYWVGYLRLKESEVINRW